jgi:nitroreductase
MEFQVLIKKRYSVRAYKPDDVPSNIIDQVLEAARLAPTAANRQSFRLFVIKTAVFKDELKKVYQMVYSSSLCHRNMRDSGRKLGSPGWKELC